jgi:aldose 1-epimerase
VSTSKRPMIRLASGSAVLEIDAARGGRFASLRIDGREILVTPPDEEDRSMLWGSFPMVPWAGRIGRAAIDWEGAHYDLPAFDGHHAIHGVAYDHAWAVERVEADEAALSCALGPAGWPLGGNVRQHVRLAPDRLVVIAEVEAERSMPAIIGWHPWFLRGPEDARVRVDASSTLETAGLIPTGRRLAVDAVTDLRAGPLLGDRQLDHVYPDPASPAVIDWPDLQLRIGFASPISTLVVHTRPHAFCVEPQTAWPNAPALAAAGIENTGLVSLEAGGCLRAEMTWSWAPPA